MIAVDWRHHLPSVAQDQKPGSHKDQKQNHNTDEDNRIEIRIFGLFEGRTAGGWVGHTGWDAWGGPRGNRWSRWGSHRPCPVSGKLKVHFYV
jgi:hypothetical protein